MATCRLSSRHAAGPSKRSTVGLPAAPGESVQESSATVVPARVSASASGRIAGSVNTMAQQQGHLDRLSPVDASFLHQERRASHMHVGALVIFEGPPPSREDFCDHIESRLPLVPRYRHKLAFPRFEMGRPFWIDDPSFNIDYHVRHTALASPGTIEQLRGLVGRIFSQRLDRSKSLWEVWLIQGLEDGRFALISKTHHALVDGVAGVDISTVLFDLSPVPPDPEVGEGGWTPNSEPSQAQLVSEGIKGLA